VVSDSTQVLLMRLRNGAQHDTVVDQPDQYNISAFATTDRPLELSAQSDVHLGRRDTAIYALPMSALLERARGPDSKRFLIELHNRFAFPAACLVLMLWAFRWAWLRGAAARAPVLSTRFCWSAFYYFLSATGTALGRQNKLPVFLAVWSANLLFAGVGTFLLWQMASGGQVLERHSGWFSRLPKPGTEWRGSEPTASRLRASSKLQPRPQRAKSRNAFPRILDEYVVREFLNTFLLVLSGFVLLMLVFTFFDLVGDILRNHIPLTTVGAYLVNLTPDMLYQIAPLAVLIATLVTFGVLNRNSEIIAMKATGISLYRLVIPIVSIAAILVDKPVSVRSVLSAAGQPQAGGVAQHHQGQASADGDSPRAQLDLRQPHPGEPGRIFYYEFFDPDRKEFANLSVFEFDPSTFSLTRRIFAARVFRDTDHEHVAASRAAGCAT
jgi:lipopolysaccharide export LptBFGC system permease protein LptF